jgi:hypothetical protein
MAQSFRPYYPRVQNRPQQGDDFQRGMQIGGVFGKDIQNLGTTLAQGIAQQKQNQVANQLLAQNYPDQPGGTDPDPDPVDAQGNPITDPDQPIPDVQLPAVKGNFQGGQAELALRMQAAKEQMSLQEMQAKLAQRKAQTALASAKGAGVQVGAGSSSRWLSGQAGGQGGGGPRVRQGAGKPTAYAPLSGDVQNDESTDNPTQIASDFDATYGQKGLYGKYMSNIASIKPDADGNYPLTDAKGDTIATIPGSDAPLWQKRTNAARIKTGLPPIGPLGQGQNPQSTSPVGTAANPLVAETPLDVRAAPFGSVIYDKTSGNTYVKQKPPAQ